MDSINQIDGLNISKTPKYSLNNYWLNILQIDSKRYRDNKESLMARLSKAMIQTRPVWYLNHLQKPYKDYESFNIDKAYELFEKSLCLPSSTNITDEEIDLIISHLK